MKPILEDIQKTMPGIIPILPHHWGPSIHYRRLANYFFEVGMKLKKDGSDDQKQKYRDLTTSLVELRKDISQTHFHEADVWHKDLELYRLKIENMELKKQVESLQKQIEFLK